MPENAPGELGHLSERFGEMAARLAEVEVLERNFLMSVSHELRTPLTAIRGHVVGAARGRRRRPRAASSSRSRSSRRRRRGSSGSSATSSTSRSSTRTASPSRARRSTWSSSSTRRTRRYSEEARAPRRSTTAQEVRDAAGDHLRRRPRAPDRRQPALERVPRDARRRPHRRSSSRRRTARSRVAVEDTGPGIPPETRERLFRPFVSDSAGGTGLGLAIAKELSGALGGRIELESEPGHGSRFELVLPAGS